MEYRTTSKQEVIWKLLQEAERKHIELSISVHSGDLDVQDKIAQHEETIKRLQVELEKTES